MPGEDGYGLLRRLREAGFSELPAIALTAYAGMPERTRALEAGFQLHLPKPVDAAELQLVVASMRRTEAAAPPSTNRTAPKP
jgi:CheY-like chemotaxis protein